MTERPRTLLAVQCSSCGTSIPDGGRFCSSCGLPVRTGSDERRLVTVLFADLVGFTALSEHRDPEQVKAILDGCFERLARLVIAHGGHVDKIVGDAMVALFGAPVAHEDDAERAVRTALEMQRELATMSSQEGEAWADLGLHIGINTGTALVGAPSSGDYTATGDVVNVASRLQAEAGAGQVIVGAATFAATSQAVRYRHLGPVTVKGRHAPVEAWLAEATTVPPGRPAGGRSVPLLGRAEELALACQTLARSVARRRAHFLLLLGEAGVGKSRLAAELAATARSEHGAIVLEGRCVPYGQANAWWPLAEALRQACAITPQDTSGEAAERCRSTVRSVAPAGWSPAEVERTTDALLHLMGDEERMADVDPVRAREEEQRGVEVLLDGLSATAPVVLVLSELHWAEPMVLGALDGLLDTLATRPVLLVGTGRPGLAERWAPRQGRHNTVSLTLDALDDEATSELLTVLLGSEPDAAVREAVLGRSGGNPLYVEELVALLNSPAAAPGTPEELPATLRGLASARLDALTPDERSLVEDAAVIGRTGGTDALISLAAAREVGDAGTVLLALAAADLLSVEDGRFAFRSDVVREVAYERLTKAERARRHFQLGTWLTERSRRLDREDEELEQIAHHFATAAGLHTEMGGVAGIPPDIGPMAVAALRRAAGRARQRELPGAAVDLLGEALALDPVDTVTLLLERASARAANGQPEAGRADLVAARRSAGSEDRELILARALVVEADLEKAAGRPADDLLTEAVDALARVGDEVGHVGALRRLGMALLVQGRDSDAAGPIGQALEAARRLGLRRDEAWALQNLAWIAFDNGAMEEAETRLHESLTAFADVGDYGGIQWGFGLLAWVRFNQGRFDEAESLAVQVVGEHNAGTDRWALAMMQLLRAGVAMWTGRPGPAADLAAAAAGIFVGMDDPVGACRALSTEVRARAAMGQVQEAERVLRQLDQLSPADKGATWAAWVDGALAAATGDLNRGARALMAAPGAGQAFGADEGTALRALLALQQGRPAEARTILASLGTPAGGPAAFSSAVESLVAAAVGDLAGAEQAATVVLAEGSGATYADRVLAYTARGLARYAAGREVDGRQDLDAGTREAEATGDVLHLLVVRMAAAAVSPGPGGEAGRRAVEDLRTSIGIRAEGWERWLAMALEPSSTSAPVA